MIRYEEFFGLEIPDAYVKSANAALRKLFHFTGNEHLLLNKHTNAIFAVYVTEIQTRSGVREVNTPAAFVTLEMLDGKPYVGFLVTSEEFRGRGLASNLIKLCQRRTTVLTLHEDSTNERLTNFYIKLGFQVVGSRDISDGRGGLLKQYYMQWNAGGSGSF